jgi:methionyl-tRNA formyltransferase
LRVAFAGTPPFAAEALQAIARAGHVVPLVLTQPDRPAGRGLKLTPSAVAVAAQTLGLPLFKPRTLRDEGAVQALRDAAPDVMVVAAYGLLLPQAVLDVPTRGCINIHASLLPRWRGAAPIQRAILAGDPETGISIMQMDAGLDTGPVLSMAQTPIGPDEDAGSLTGRLGALGAECIIDALANLARLVPRPQDDARATYAAKVTGMEAALDWRRPAAELARQVRAFNPVPGAFTRLGGDLLKVWQARAVMDATGAAGAVLEDDRGRLRVGCGEGALELLSVQRSGARRVAATDFLRGAGLAPGAVFEPVSEGSGVS